MAEYILTINERNHERRVLRKFLQANKLVKVRPLAAAKKRVMVDASIHETSLAKEWLSKEDARWDDPLK